MKNIMILVLITLSVLAILVSGCGQKLGEPLCKTPYFEYKTGDCCLDENSNQICDSDEKEEVERTPEVYEKDEKTVDRALELMQISTVTESCTNNPHFECIWSSITKEEVEFNLRSKKNGIFIFTKISLSGLEAPCERIFDPSCIDCEDRYGCPNFDIPGYESFYDLCEEGKTVDIDAGLKFDQIIKLNLSCDLSDQDFIDSQIIMEGIFYEDGSFPVLVGVRSKISGAVR